MFNRKNNDVKNKLSEIVNSVYELNRRCVEVVKEDLWREGNLIHLTFKTTVTENKEVIGSFYFNLDVDRNISSSQWESILYEKGDICSRFITPVLLRYLLKFGELPFGAKGIDKLTVDQWTIIEEPILGRILTDWNLCYKDVMGIDFFSLRNYDEVISIDNLIDEYHKNFIKNRNEIISKDEIEKEIIDYVNNNLDRITFIHEKEVWVNEIKNKK